MNKILDLIKAEPVLFQGIVQAGLGMLISFGLHWTTGQMADFLAFSAAILTFLTRTQVTSHPNNPLMNGEVKKEEK